MKGRERLYKEIFDRLQVEKLDVDKLAYELADGRVYEELGDELANILTTLTISKNMNVLEIEAGCGVGTRYLANKARKVTAYVTNEEQLKINKLLNSDNENINYITTLQDLEDDSYDLIIVHPLEDDVSLIKKYDTFLDHLMPYLTDNTRIVYLIDNQMGFDYWNGKGVREGIFQPISDTDGKYVSGVQIEKILKKRAFSYRYYYPYPNLKFTRILFSDERLPKKGELLKYFRDNFEFSNLELFNEAGAYDNIIENGLFQRMSNAYMIIASLKEVENKFIYAKFSMDRDLKYAISTEILSSKYDNMIVKRPLTKMARTHIERLPVIEQRLNERFEGTNIYIVPCRKKEDGIYSPFVKGKTLITILEECASNNDLNKIDMLVQDYIKVLYKGCETKRFIPSERFKDIFGEISVIDDCVTAPFSDLDLNFDNIIVNDKWNIIDYEWSFDFEIPQKYILYRAMLYWRQSTGGHILRSWSEWMNICDVSSQEEEIFGAMEQKFQKFVFGNKDGFADIAEKYRKPIYGISNYGYQQIPVKIYLDYGEGFIENNTQVYMWQNAFASVFDKKIILPDGIKYIRLDPGEESCMVKVTAKTGDGTRLHADTEAEKIEGDVYVFANDDPSLIFKISEDIKVIELHLADYREKSETQLYISSEQRIKELQEVQEKQIENIKKKYEEELEEKNRLIENLSELSQMMDVVERDEKWIASKMSLFGKKIKSSNLIIHMDQFEKNDADLNIRGWAFVPELIDNNINQYFLIQKDQDRILEVKHLHKIKRVDVACAYIDVMNNTMVGFEDVIEGVDFDKKIGIRITNKGLKNALDYWFD